MWEEAAKIELGGIQVYTFGLYAAGGALLALIALCLLAKKRKWPAGAGALLFLVSGVLGFVFSRLFYCLLDRRLGGIVPFKYWFMVSGGGFSMMGLLLGACLGALLIAPFCDRKKGEGLDIVCIGFALFAVLERLGEGAVADFGLSRPLIGDLLKSSFLAVTDDYDAYLATYLLEAAAMLVLFIVLFTDHLRKQKPGDTFLLFLLLFGAVQTVMESLRFDQHLRVSFVGLQQVMAVCLLGGAVIYLALTRGGNKPGLKRAAMLSIPLCVLVCLGLEFAIDRTNVNRYLLYALFVLALAAPAALGIRLRKEGK